MTIGVYCEISDQAGTSELASVHATQEAADKDARFIEAKRNRRTFTKPLDDGAMDAAPALSGRNAPVLVELTPELAEFLERYVDGQYLATLHTLTSLHMADTLTEMKGGKRPLSKAQAMRFVQMMEPLKAIRAAVRKGIENDLS